MGYIPDPILQNRYIESVHPTATTVWIKNTLSKIGIQIIEPMAFFTALIIGTISTVLTIINLTDFGRSIVYFLFAINNFGSALMHSTFADYAIVMDAFTIPGTLIPLSFVLMSSVTIDPTFRVLLIVPLIAVNLMMFKFVPFKGAWFDSVEIALGSNVSMIVFLIFHMLGNIGTNRPDIYTKIFPTFIYGSVVLGIFAIALGFQILSRTNGTVSRFQKTIGSIYPHSLWHVLVGVIVWLLVEKVVVPINSILANYPDIVQISISGLFDGSKELWVHRLLSIVGLFVFYASSFIALVSLIGTLIETI